MKNLWQLHPQLADDTHPLATFALCELRLMDDANYPWLVLVPRVAEAVELIDLDAAQRHALTDEIDRASRLLRDAFRPEKLNVAALGNLVPHHMLSADVDELKVQTITVDTAPVLKRFHARAKGRGNRIWKRNSHIIVTVGDGKSE